MSQYGCPTDPTKKENKADPTLLGSCLMYIPETIENYFLQRIHQVFNIMNLSKTFATDLNLIANSHAISFI